MPETTTLADWLWTSYRYLNWAQEDYVTMHRIPNDVYEVYPFQSNDPKYKVVESVVNNRLHVQTYPLRVKVFTPLRPLKSLGGENFNP